MNSPRRVSSYMNSQHCGAQGMYSIFGINLGVVVSTYQASFRLPGWSEFGRILHEETWGPVPCVCRNALKVPIHVRGVHDDRTRNCLFPSVWAWRMGSFENYDISTWISRQATSSVQRCLGRGVQPPSRSCCILWPLRSSLPSIFPRPIRFGEMRWQRKYLRGTRQKMK